MTSVRNPKPLRFYNPIAGKPVPFNLSGLFLFDPSTLLKLHGLSMRRLLSEEWGDSFYKQWERLSKGKGRVSPTWGKAVLDRLPPDSPITDEFRVALNGNTDLHNRKEQRGLWELFFLGAGEDLNRLSGRGALLLSIEQASHEPTRLIRDGAIDEAVETMCADPVLGLFLWPEVVDAMGRCKAAEKFLPAQAAVACEVLLSYVAATDAELATSDESTLACLLPGEHAPGKNPTSLFFGYLRETVGAKSLRDFFNHPKAKTLALDMATLKRWSAGSHCPDLVWLRALLHAFFGDSSFPPVLNRYWGARYLSLIGYFSQILAERAKKLPTASGAPSPLSPWPSYPFGYSSCESWIQSRYPYWFKYHLEQRQARPDSEQEKRPTKGFFS